MPSKRRVLSFIFLITFGVYASAQQKPLMQFKADRNYSVKIHGEVKARLRKNDILYLYSSEKAGSDSLVIISGYIGRKAVILKREANESASASVELDTLSTVFGASDKRMADSIQASSILNINEMMVLVKGGWFVMGLSDSLNVEGGAAEEKPQHRVRLHGYFISKFEVTQALWVAVMDSNPSVQKDCPLCPVDNVSWNDAMRFIERLNTLTKENFRLPTEAEWEFAARGGIKSKGYLFSGSDSVDNVAWYHINTGSKPVGMKEPNELGLYDMSGNINEWCSDWYSAYTKEPAENPQGPAKGTYKVSRGGNWILHEEGCYVAMRTATAPGYKDRFMGFRLAKDLK